jgi:hypothetical protein
MQLAVEHARHELYETGTEPLLGKTRTNQSEQIERGQPGGFAQITARMTSRARR